MNKRNFLRKLLISQTNIKFDDFVNLIKAFGFRFKRIKGSHHIYANDNIREILNIQPEKGEVKPYQVKKFLKYIERYSLLMEE